MILKNLEKLKDTYVELTNQVILTAEEEESLEDTINQIAELNPELIQGYDAQGNVILKQVAAWESIVALQKESLELARQEAAMSSIATGYAAVNVAKKELNEDLIRQREEAETDIELYKAEIANLDSTSGGIRSEYTQEAIERYEAEIAELEKNLLEFMPH